MRVRIGLMMAAALLTLCRADIAEARAIIRTHPAFPDKMRKIEGGRKILIIRPGNGIRPSLEHMPEARRVDGKTFLIFESNQALAEHQEEILVETVFISPVQDAVWDYPLDARVRSGVDAAVVAAPWIDAREIELTRNDDPAHVERQLNLANCSQMLVISSDNAMSHDYSQLSVSLEVTLLLRQIPKGQHSYARLAPEYIPFDVTYVAVAKLPDPDPESREANRRRWVAEHGLLAHRALDQGLDFVLTRLATDLSQSEGQSEAWTKRRDRKGTLPNGKAGWILEQTARSLTFFEARSRRLIRETTLSQSASD